MKRLLLSCACVYSLVMGCRRGMPAPALVPTSTSTLTPSPAPTFALTPTSTPTPSPMSSPVTTSASPITPTSTGTALPISVGEADISVDCATPLTDGPVPYGISSWWTDQDAALWRVRYAELAPQIVRLPLAHHYLEPTNDDGDPAHIHWDGFRFDEPIPASDRTVTYRRWFEVFRDLDVTLMLHVPNLAGWLSANGDQGLASTYPPKSVAEYGEFVEATLRFLVKEVDYPPERIIVEAINEPDLGCGQDPAVPCYWDNWTMEDLVAVMRAARQACDAVDPAIRLVGLSTCCHHELVDQLIREYDGLRLLDGLTYHLYEPEFRQTRVIQVGERLADWGLPVYINEYGSSRYWSDGEMGALWHGAALAQIWPRGIAPMQFSVSEFPGMHEGYNQLGLTADWRAGWKPKPAYAIYVGFSHHLGPTTPISTAAQAPLAAAAGRGEDGSIAVWVVSLDPDGQSSTEFRIKSFSADVATVTVYDILSGGGIVDGFTVTGAPLAFAYAVPAHSVYVFLLTAVS